MTLFEEAKQSQSTMKSCTCEACINMCKYRPCWPTPEEAQYLIDAGFGPRLMCEWYADDENSINEFNLLCPAIVGYEGQRAPFWPVGICTFLNNGLCELHDLGLKPGEGREEWCKNVNHDDIHKKYALSWNNKKGQILVEKWYIIGGGHRNENIL